MASLEHIPSTLVDTFIQHLKVFKIIGLDFLEDPKACLVNRCRYIWFIILLILFFTGQVFFFLKSDEMGAEFLDVANGIPTLLLAAQDLFKIGALSKKDRIRRVILEIAALWPEEIQNEERELLMKSWLRNLNIFNHYVYKFVGFGLVVFVWAPFLITVFASADGDATYLLPFQLYYPFKIDSMLKYTAAFLHQAISGSIIHMCLYLPCDLLLFSLTVDICILMRLVQYDLENIRVVGPNGNGLSDASEVNKSYHEITQLARTHQKLVGITESLNEGFGAIIFAVVSLSSIILCFFGFLTIAFREMRYQLIRQFVAVLVTLSIVFCLALPGQFLYDASCGVADAAYNSLWYKSDLKFRKIIFIIIARAQKPCQLSALGYYYINFNTFCKVCSTAWSYLSLLNQMYQETDH